MVFAYSSKTAYFRHRFTVQRHFPALSHSVKKMSSTFRVLRSHTKTKAPSAVTVPVQSPGNVKKEVKKASNTPSLAKAIKQKNSEILWMRGSIVALESQISRVMAKVAMQELEVKTVPDTRTLEEKFVVPGKRLRATYAYILADRLKNKTQLEEDLKERLSYVRRVLDGWKSREYKLWYTKTFSPLVNAEKKAAEKAIFDSLMADQKKKAA